MPNGGVPIHMILRLKNNPEIVIYSFSGNLLFFSREEWETNSLEVRKPIIAINESEAKVMAWFIDYWVGNSKHYESTYGLDGVDVQYDY
jgi:hypothetical protein